MQTPLPSIQRRILSSIAVVLLALTLILTAGFGLLTNRQVKADLSDRMTYAMQVAWQEYEEGPRQMAAAIQALSSLPAFMREAELGSPEQLRPYLLSLGQTDFAALVDEDRSVIAHTTPSQGGQAAPFIYMVDEAIRQNAAQISTELVSADWTATHMESALSRLYVPSGCDPSSDGCLDRGLVQVVAVPINLGDGRKGVLMAGVLLNNTQSIPMATSNRMHGSYLSISVEGLRISDNITTNAGRLPVGEQQSEALLRSVRRGERYYGTVPVGRERHYVVSDPIRDSAGQVVGALSLGLPPSGFAQIGRPTQVLILMCALFALLGGILAARLIARRLAEPIISLERDVLRLAAAHKTQELQHAAAQIKQANPSVYSHEMLTLYESFRTLADSLVHLTQETQSYLERVERDRMELQGLTEELQEAKSQLERKVEERTRELEQAVQELRRANVLKSQFLATMSHELRTPLNSVIGFSEMMADQLVGPLTPSQQEYLGHILASARHLLQLISDILDLSRIEQGRMVLDLQEVLLPELVESVQAKVIHQVASAGLSLQVELTPEIPSIQADPMRIREVLFNLLSNAIKFTPAGGTIWMRLRQDGEEAVVEVEDTGIGIRPEDQAAVFDEFVQAESTYHRRFEGAGLGLPLSKKLVELHGGRIELESELSKGTRVRFYLPLRKGE